MPLGRGIALTQLLLVCLIAQALHRSPVLDLDRFGCEQRRGGVGLRQRRLPLLGIGRVDRLPDQVSDRPAARARSPAEAPVALLVQQDVRAVR